MYIGNYRYMSYSVSVVGTCIFFFTLNFREQVQSLPKSAPDQAQKNQEVQFCDVNHFGNIPRERELTPIQYIHVLTFLPAKSKADKAESHMTREELERHLESRQHSFKIEKAPAMLPMEIFSNDNSNPDRFVF